MQLVQPTFEHIPLVIGMASSFPIEVQTVANKTSSHHSNCTDYGYLDSATATHDDASRTELTQFTCADKRGVGVVDSGRGEMTEQDGVSKEVQWNGKEEAGLEEESEEEEDDSAGEDEGRTGYSLLSQGSSSDEEDITSCCLDEQDHQQVNTTPVGSQPVANDIRISKTTCCSYHVLEINVVGS